ncbi:MAG: carboxypeptidase-like regulatory domain-containing protein [Pyrinomonadaceae bacterium]
MYLRKSFAAFLLIIMLAAATAFAQKTETTGGIKGKVRDEDGNGKSGVTVILRQGERELMRVTTNSKGEFNISGLEPGTYGLTFRKPGLSVGTLEDVLVRAGKTKELRDGLILKVDEGSIAFLRGSVFNENGRSVSNVRVEIARVAADGAVKKFDSRITNETGSFVFRLTPDAATYRVTVKAGNSQPVSKDVQIDGPAVYRVALSLPSSAK